MRIFISKILIVLLVLIYSPVEAKDVPQNGKTVIFEVFVRDDNWFEYLGIIHDAEALTEVLRRAIWNKRENQYVLRWHCKPSKLSFMNLSMMKDRLDAGFVKGVEEHDKCKPVAENVRKLELKPIIQANMKKRTLSNEEMKFIGIWEGQHKNINGDIEYAWSMDRKADGSYQTNFFNLDKAGKKNLIQKTEGFWWLSDNHYNEVQDGLHALLVPDVYNYSIVKEKIHFKHRYKIYEFIDHRLK